MKMRIVKILDCAEKYLVEQNMNILAALILAGVMVFLTTACGEIDGGTIQNEVTLPLDSTLNLYCEDVGIFEEKCVLDDPENPYARVSVTEENKFDLQDDAPSAKSRFYLWATALAKGAGIPGENQFYTALSLHEIYAESGSPTTQEQAKKAYRSVLDNYFDAPTFYGPFTPDQIYFAVSVKDLVGANLVNPTAANLVSLYNDPAIARADLSLWGYVYDEVTGIVSAFK
jgi:hypothetical protein